MDAVAIQQMADRVAALLEERLRVRGRSLAVKLRRGGRALPRKVRTAAETLAAAAEKARHPKLMGQIDRGAVADAYTACMQHLSGIDPKARWRDMLANMVSFIGFGIMFLVIGLLTVLIWRGYL